MFDTVWDLYLSVSTVKKKKGFSQYLHQCIRRCRTVSLLLHRRRNYCFTTWQTASSQANEHLSSISERAALTTSTQLKLKHMKASVLVIQEVHKHPSLDAEPSGFFHLHQNIACLYHLVLIVFVCLFVCSGGFPFAVTSFRTSCFPSLLHFWPDFSIVFILGV